MMLTFLKIHLYYWFPPQVAVTGNSLELVNVGGSPHAGSFQLNIVETYLPASLILQYDTDKKWRVANFFILRYSGFVLEYWFAI